MKRLVKLAMLGLLVSLVAIGGCCEYVDFDRVCGRIRVRKYFWGIPVGSWIEETRISELYRDLVERSPPGPLWVVEGRGSCWVDVLLPSFRHGLCSDTGAFRGRLASWHVATALDGAEFAASVKRAILERFFAYVRDEEGGTRLALDYAFKLEYWVASRASMPGRPIGLEDMPEVLR